ncbi:MAG: hypothetical protein ACLR56_08895 [Oscillospiraceae bacterium]
MTARLKFSLSMLFKSTDESLATVDISSIDLYNGQVELYRLGQPTVIRRSGRTGKAEHLAACGDTRAMYGLTRRR